MILNSPFSLWVWRAKQEELVVTNGVFDILHLGHIRYLQEAAKRGKSLLVGINDDKSVKKLKGEDRPINTQKSRAEVLDSLRCVNAVYIFHDTEATDFLNIAKPDWYVKAGDYSEETMNKNELSVLKKSGSRLFFPCYHSGHSTTSIINKIKNEKF